MIVTVTNLLDDSSTEFHGTPESVERQLRDKFEPFVQRVPYGDLTKCLYKINLSSVYHAEVRD